MYCGSVVGGVRVYVVREARVLWFDVRSFEDDGEAFCGWRGFGEGYYSS